MKLLDISVVQRSYVPVTGVELLGSSAFKSVKINTVVLTDIAQWRQDLRSNLNRTHCNLPTESKVLHLSMRGMVSRSDIVLLAIIRCPASE